MLCKFADWITPAFGCPWFGRANDFNPIPLGRWVQPQIENATMWQAGNEPKAELVVHHRDTKFSFACDRQFYDAGIKRVRTPLLAPGQ